MKTIKPFLSLVIFVATIASCTKEPAKEDIKPNRIIGNWASKSHKTTTYLNSIPLSEKTIDYNDKDYYIMNFATENKLFKTYYNSKDTNFGTYGLSGTMLYTELKSLGVGFKDTFTFNVDDLALKISYFKDIDSAGKVYTYGNQITLERK